MSQRYRFAMLSVALCWLAMSQAAYSQCPPQTIVADTLRNADGSPAEGRVVIGWPTFQAGSCQVVASQATVIITAGALTVPLYPNDAAVPSGTSYRVTYYLKSGRITTEYWVVPSSASAVTLATVRSPSVPIPPVMISQAQVTNLLPALAQKVELPAPCPAGKFLQANGAATPPQVTCVDGTGAPLASSTQSGTVKTDTNEADPLVYTKLTTDSLLADKALVAHNHDAADTTSGVFAAARLPSPTATTLGGVLSGNCTSTDKVSGISTLGELVCSPDQIGGGGSGPQHQANGLALVSNDPVNFQDSASILFSNPTAGNIQAVIKDASILAAKLAVASPSNSQLSGIGDNNLPVGALSPNRIVGTSEVQTSKGAANGYPGLDGSSRVIQDPANTQVAPGASKMPLADGNGKLDDGWLSTNVSLLGQSISLASEVTGTLPLASGGTNATAFTASRCVRVNDSGTSLESATADCGAGGGGAPTDAQYVVTAFNGSLSNERRLQGTSNRITLSDGGANSDLVLDVGSEVATSSSVFTAHVPLDCTNPRVKSGAGNAFFDVEGLATGDFDIQVGKFVDSGDGRITCFGRVPNELAASPAAAFIFDVQPHAACGASQNFRVNVRYRFWSSGSADTALTAETAQNILGATTAHTLTRATFPATGNLASAPAAGNNIVLEIQRDGAHANDNCAQVMELLPLSMVLRADLKVKP